MLIPTIKSDSPAALKYPLVLDSLSPAHPIPPPILCSLLPPHGAAAGHERKPGKCGSFEMFCADSRWLWKRQVSFPGVWRGRKDPPHRTVASLLPQKLHQIFQAIFKRPFSFLLRPHAFI
ncbi:hypothetical protein E2C01_048186 [Portunus trituberculatus]|uniref:Uncharacterized protein n=1 Tax=Portunus trituberculatus TaxID=210409 RepID=A0A5B7G9W9_PORTR|nr:hypothetical protein [Portunus trituberculatus]